MTERPTHKTVAGSTYLNLRKLARRFGRPTSELLQLYALEGFLSRLSQSEHRNRFVLKGGMLLAAFDLRRPTLDVDFLALRTDNDQETVRVLVAEIAGLEVNDGLVFRLDTITASTIREEEAYPGIRVRIEATLSTAKLLVHADINIGDPVIPGPANTVIPALLDRPTINILAYPRAMVVAEKVITALQRGSANTRWRDFSDLYLLLGKQVINESELVPALRDVARYRQTQLKPLSDALMGFAERSQLRWQAWRRRQGFEQELPESLTEVVDAIASNVDQALRSAAGDEQQR